MSATGFDETEGSIQVLLLMEALRVLIGVSLGVLLMHWNRNRKRTSGWYFRGMLAFWMLFVLFVQLRMSEMQEIEFEFLFDATPPSVGEADAKANANSNANANDFDTLAPEFDADSPIVGMENLRRENLRKTLDLVSSSLEKASGGGGSGNCSPDDVFPCGCDWKCYLMLNPDVAEALDWTEEIVTAHYRHFAKKEARSCDCAVNTRSYPYCCHLYPQVQNIGHGLTENGLDAHRCGPVVAFEFTELDKTDVIHAQYLEFAKILNTTVTTTDECLLYYHSNPGSHPSDGRGRLQAYSKLVDGHRPWYDALETARGLRETSQRVLRFCGIEPDRFKPYPYDDPTGGREDVYEPLVERRPSRSVLIVVRRPMRTLLNYGDLLSVCRELKLSCRILDTATFWKEEVPNKSGALCHVLREFNRDDPLVIGVAGAELFYALFSQLRVFVTSFMVQKTYHPNPGCRFGKKTNPLVEKTEPTPEEIVHDNLVCKGYGIGTDPYFLEFAFMYGARIQLIGSDGVNSTLDETNRKKAQCINSPYYCQDRIADVEEVKTELQKMIHEGTLLTRKFAATDTD